VPELLQDDATPENLAQALLNLLSDATVRSRIDLRFSRLLAELRQDTGRRIVDALLPMLDGRPA